MLSAREDGEGVEGMGEDVIVLIEVVFVPVALNHVTTVQIEASREKLKDVAKDFLAFIVSKMDFFFSVNCQ
jgi:hypothetical protein